MSEEPRRTMPHHMQPLRSWDDDERRTNQSACCSSARQHLSFAWPKPVPVSGRGGGRAVAFEINSAGTHGYHEATRLTRAAWAEHGLIVDSIARPVVDADFDRLT
jgi:hypothetical protein